MDINEIVRDWRVRLLRSRRGVLTQSESDSRLQPRRSGSEYKSRSREPNPQPSRSANASQRRRGIFRPQSRWRRNVSKLQQRRNESGLKSQPSPSANDSRPSQPRSVNVYNSKSREPRQPPPRSEIVSPLRNVVLRPPSSPSHERLLLEVQRAEAAAITAREGIAAERVRAATAAAEFVSPPLPKNNTSRPPQLSRSVSLQPPPPPPRSDSTPSSPRSEKVRIQLPPPRNNASPPPHLPPL